jgi:hypothetical protein
LIVAAALIVSGEPTTAAALLAAADKAQRDLMLELDPVERELRASVERELRAVHMIDLPEEISTDDLPVVLSAAAARALESLTNLTNDTAS